MTGPVAFHFEVAGRRPLTIRRRLARRVFGLREVLGNVELALPPLAPDADGYMLASLPAARLTELPRAAGGLLVYVQQVQPRYYAAMAGGFDAYMAGFSGKTRSTLKRKTKKFEELSGGKLDIREYRTPGEIVAFHALARQLSARTYQERLLDAGLPDTPEYLADMLRLAEAGGARGYLLFLDGRPVSYLYVPIEDGVAIYAFLGYDPDLREHSPGTVLQLEAMARLFGEPHVELFDFTDGDTQHKRQFGTGHVECAVVALLRPTLVNRLLVGAHRGFNDAVGAMGRAAERHGVKARLRRLLRS